MYTHGISQPSQRNLLENETILHLTQTPSHQDERHINAFMCLGTALMLSSVVGLVSLTQKMRMEQIPPVYEVVWWFP